MFYGSTIHTVPCVEQLYSTYSTKVIHYALERMPRKANSHSGRVLRSAGRAASKDAHARLQLHVQDTKSKPRGWVFTFYGRRKGLTLKSERASDATEFEDKIRTLYDEGKIIRYCFQEELCKTTNRWHLQGYLQLSSPQRSSYLSTNLWKACFYGSARSDIRASAYTQKSDTYIQGTTKVQVGDFAVSKGYRTDLADVQRGLDGGASVVAISHSHFPSGANTDGPSLTTSSSEGSFQMPTSQETLSAPDLCCTELQELAKHRLQCVSGKCMEVFTCSRNPCVPMDKSGSNGTKANLSALLMISAGGSRIALCLHCVTGMLQDWLSREGLHGVVLDTSSLWPTNPLVSGQSGESSTSPLSTEDFR